MVGLSGAKIGRWRHYCRYTAKIDDLFGVDTMGSSILATNQMTIIVLINFDYINRLIASCYIGVVGLP